MMDEALGVHWVAGRTSRAVYMYISGPRTGKLDRLTTMSRGAGQGGLVFCTMLALECQMFCFRGAGQEGLAVACSLRVIFG